MIMVKLPVFDALEKCPLKSYHGSVHMWIQFLNHCKLESQGALMQKLYQPPVIDLNGTGKCYHYEGVNIQVQVSTLTTSLSNLL